MSAPLAIGKRVKLFTKTFIWDLIDVEPLNSGSSNLFNHIQNVPFTFSEALDEAKIQNRDFIMNASMTLAFMAKEDPEIKSLGLTDDEAAAISCYTLEGENDSKPPHQVINESLVGSRNRTNIFSLRKLLLLLLSGLRKLPRFKPSGQKMLYRGLRTKVPLNRMEATRINPKGESVIYQYYIVNRVVTWWGFTSTSADLDATEAFIDGVAKNTLFNIGGDDLWGYNIKAFSQFPEEEEILLEPETRIEISKIVPLGDSLEITCIFQKFKSLAFENVIPVGGIKMNPPQNNQTNLANMISPQNQSAPVIAIPPANQSIPVITIPPPNQSVPVNAIPSANQIKSTIGLDYSWKECPNSICKERKYFVDRVNRDIAIKLSDDYSYSTIIGKTPIPLSKTTSWSIKILRSKNNDGCGICVGVAPFNISQDGKDNSDKCGWYFNCYCSSLCSGPPHNYWDKAYGLEKESGKSLHTGDSVGVVLDTTKGELSFVLNEVSLGIAYEGIPLDKPLVPCVLLYCEDDSVELDTSEVSEKEDSSIPIPSKIRVDNATWDSISFTWDPVDDASFYQIEIDGNKLWISEKNSFTKKGFLQETGHTIRVRAVKGKSVSTWSVITKGRTQKAPEFTECIWRECPGYVDKEKKYLVDDKSKKSVKHIGSGNKLCTVIGSTLIPPIKISSWHIKTRKKTGAALVIGPNTCVGVAPSDINQNENTNSIKCGWYFDCYASKLYSGPPHNYNGKEYGSRKLSKCVRAGGSVGVVMATTSRGELSFYVNGINQGIAYEKIPLDKPLVPCVILVNEGDSAELDLSEVKENEVCVSVPVPSNVTLNRITWNSATFSWDKVKGATFYQIGMNGSKSWDGSTENEITKRGLSPDTKYYIRIRTVKGTLVSEWSDFMSIRTQVVPKFSGCVWEKYDDDYIDYEKRYSLNRNNPKIATKINETNYCTIICDTPLPINKEVPWTIKVLKSKNNDGKGIFVGVAPFDIDQNSGDNQFKCGWYLNCYHSVLCSGPPHKYKNKRYNQVKKEGNYVHTGDSVGVAIDTKKGVLSYSLDSLYCGIAYEGIPLDRPLVPCVLLWNKGDSVELILF